MLMWFCVSGPIVKQNIRVAKPCGQELSHGRYHVDEWEYGKGSITFASAISKLAEFSGFRNTAA